MKRKILLILLASGATGCNKDNPTPAKTSSPPAETFPIDYANWPQLTEQPVNIPLAVMMDCRAPQPSPEFTYGPHYGDHFQYSVRYFVNPTSESAVRKAGTALPIGTTIVKEKLTSDKAKEKGKLTAIAAMVKREPGYAKEQGDWEYMYAEIPAAEKSMKVTKGQIATCVECHTKSWQSDYLFRTYLRK
jgi:hypothetical protein